MSKRPREEDAALDTEQPNAKRRPAPVVNLDESDDFGEEDVITPVRRITYGCTARRIRPGNTPRIRDTTPSEPEASVGTDIIEESVDDLEDFLPSTTVKLHLREELEFLRATDVLEPVPEEPEANGVEVSESEDDPENSAGVDGNEEKMQVDTNTEDQQSLPVETAPASSNKCRKKKRRAFFDPRMWPEGAQVPGLRWKSHLAAKYEGIIKSIETGITLDKDETNDYGSIWWEMKRSALSPDLVTKVKWEHSAMKREHIPLYARTDFMKACIRLGGMVRPEQLSVLLGGGERNPEYCQFLLAGMLGLLNNPKTRQLAGGRDNEPQREPQGEVVVRADNDYPSDDELVKSLEDSECEASESAVACVNLDAMDILPKPSSHMHPSKPPSKGEDEKDQIENRFWHMIWSYATRTYVCNLSGRFYTSFEVYAKEAALRGGITFERASHAPRLPGLNEKTAPGSGRVRWRTEPMPAPELGDFASVKQGTLELWKWATKKFSMKQMARCSLIQGDAVLDWLTYVSSESVVSVTEKEFYEDRNPPVSIAPIPMLYLADKAVETVLEVLRSAAHIANFGVFDDGTLDGDFEIETDRHVITNDDILSAAGWVLGEEKHRFAKHAFSEPPYNNEGELFSAWPTLLERPMTKSENIIVCDRVPVSSIDIPLNAVDETQAVLLSLRQPVRRFLYTNQKCLKTRDPLTFLLDDEKEKRKDQIRKQRREHGIVIHPKHPGGFQVKAEGEEPPVERSAADSSSGVEQNSTKTEAKHPGYQDMMGNTTLSLEKREKGLNNPDHWWEQVSIAEIITTKIGTKTLVERRNSVTQSTPEQLKQNAEAMSGDLAHFLKTAKHFPKRPSRTVCYHRLGWICLHALGRDVESDSLDDGHSTGYGATANYTNFGEVPISDHVTIHKSALDVLVQLADVIIRDEAEVLMSCAAHDDNRPWIDRADVILVTSVRKQKYEYVNMGRSTIA